MFFLFNVLGCYTLLSTPTSPFLHVVAGSFSGVQHFYIYSFFKTHSCFCFFWFSLRQQVISQSAPVL